MDEGEASAQMLGVNENVNEDGTKFKPINNNRTRICLVGEVAKDQRTCQAAYKFGVPVELTETGSEFVDDGTWENVFVMQEFSGPMFDHIFQSEHRIVGPTALQQYAAKEAGPVLPANTRPLYTLAMAGFVICFTGFRMKEDLTRMMQLIHNMGGSIRKEMSTKVTHLIANCCDGEKYTYASTFRVPIMGASWVQAVWDQRGDPAALAGNADLMATHKLKPFHNATVCFVGFPDDECQHMTDVLVENGGRTAEMDDPACSYVVVDSANTYNALAASLSVPPAPDWSGLSPSCSSPPPKIYKSSCVTSPTGSCVTSPVRSCVTSPDRSCVTSPVRSGIISPVRSGITSPVGSGVKSSYSSCVTSPDRSCLSPRSHSCLSPSGTCVTSPNRCLVSSLACTPPTNVKFRRPLFRPEHAESKTSVSLKTPDLNDTFMDTTHPDLSNPLTDNREPERNHTLSERLSVVDSEQFTTPVKTKDSRGGGTYVSNDTVVSSCLDAAVFKTPTSTPRRRSVGDASRASPTPVEGRQSVRRRTITRLVSTFKTPTLTRNSHRKSMSHFDFLLHRGSSGRKHRNSSLTPDVPSVAETPESDRKQRKDHHQRKDHLQTIKGLFTSMYNGKDTSDKVSECEANRSAGTVDAVIIDCVTGTSPLGIIHSPRNLSFPSIPFNVGPAESSDASLSGSFHDDTPPTILNASFSKSPAAVQYVASTTDLSPVPFDSGVLEESCSTPKRLACDPTMHTIGPSCTLSPIHNPDCQANRTCPAGGDLNGLLQLTNAPVLDNTFTY